MAKQKLGMPRYFVKCEDCSMKSGDFKYKHNIGGIENVKKSKLFSGCTNHKLTIIKKEIRGGC